MHQPLKYHGGKHYLAARIIDMMPTHIHYVETHFGGGSVFLQKPYINTSECVNDLDGILMNFWTVLQDETKFNTFRRMLEATPVSESLFRFSINEIEKARQDLSDLSDIMLAVNFFIVMRQSRQGLGKSFTTLSRNRTRRGMQESAASWLTAIEGLPEVHARLKGVVIYSKDALNVIHEQDGDNTLFYLDPPYLHETRNAKQCYAHEMSCMDHEMLLYTLGNIKGKFILSGYNNSLYERFAKKHGWNHEVFSIDNKASSTPTKEVKEEYVWYNYDRC